MSSGSAPRIAQAEPRRPLASLCTLGVGGPAQWLVRVRELEALRNALAWARDEGWRLTLLAGGSNVVIADRGLPGLTLQVRHQSLHTEVRGEEVHVRVGAGLEWDDLVRLTVSRGWAGLECLSGIPGHVGATPIQNVGAYGQDVAQVIERVVVLDRANGELQEIAAADCGFGYRQSRFKAADAERFIVWEVGFRLRRHAPPTLSHRGLAERLHGKRPDLKTTRQAVLALRGDKDMLCAAGSRGSCGSFFVNPIVSTSTVQALAARWGEPPCHAQPGNGRWKVPAAWLIERAGFHKGQRWGRVGLSEQHALAITSDPGATARQVVSVARRIRDGVHQTVGIELQPEPRFLGFDAFDVGGLPVGVGAADSGSPAD